MRETTPPVGSRLFCETNPMFVPRRNQENGTPLVATRRKRRGGPVAHRQRIFPFFVWIARSSLWDTDPP